MAVVCVGFLAVLLILGILRVRAGQQRAAQEDASAGSAGSGQQSQQEVEMAWDDTALNITVNPIQVRDLQHDLENG